MPDINMNVFNNPNLGANSHLSFLDEVAAQEQENAAANSEGRAAQAVQPRNRFGSYAGTGQVSPITLAPGTPVENETSQVAYTDDLEIEIADNQRGTAMTPEEQTIWNADTSGKSETLPY